QRDGAGDHGALAGADAARQTRQVESSRAAARRHKFALDLHAVVVVPAPPPRHHMPISLMHSNWIGRYHEADPGWLTFGKDSYRPAAQEGYHNPRRGSGRDVCVDERARPLGPRLYPPALPPLQVLSSPRATPPT